MSSYPIEPSVGGSSAAYTPPLPADDGSIESPSSEDHDDGDDWLVVPGKWLETTSGATVHLLLPLAYQCTNNTVDQLN